MLYIYSVAFAAAAAAVVSAAKTQAAASSGSGGGDEATYRNALIEFLKKNGPTPLASLGQKVKKPASLPKMAAFLKANPNTFSVEGGKCSLK